MKKLMRAALSLINGMSPKTRKAYMDHSLRQLPKRLRSKLSKEKLKEFVQRGIRPADLGAKNV